MPVERIPEENKRINTLKGLETNEAKTGGEEKNVLSRRKFMKNTLLAGAGAAAALSGADKLVQAAERIANLDVRRIQEELKKTATEEKGNNKIESLEKFDAKKVAEEILEAFNELARKKELWPRKLFDDDFVLAMTAQESAGRKDAVSEDKAVGVLQVTPIAVADVVLFLNSLKCSGRVEFNGPEEVTTAQATAIQNIIKTNGDYGRAFGKIFLMRIFDKQNGFGIGQKHFAKQNYEAAQTDIAGFYNAGNNIRQKIGKRRIMKPFALWPKETREYCKYIKMYQKTIKKIRSAFAAHKLGLSRENENYAVNLIINSAKIPKSTLGRLDEKDFYPMATKIISIKKEKEMDTQVLTRDDIAKVINT